MEIKSFYGPLIWWIFPHKNSGQKERLKKRHEKITERFNTQQLRILIL